MTSRSSELSALLGPEWLSQAGRGHMRWLKSQAEGASPADVGRLHCLGARIWSHVWIVSPEEQAMGRQRRHPRLCHDGGLRGPGLDRRGKPLLGYIPMGAADDNRCCHRILLRHARGHSCRPQSPDRSCDSLPGGRVRKHFQHRIGVPSCHGPCPRRSEQVLPKEHQLARRRSG